MIGGNARQGTDELRAYVDRHTAQYALLGIQFLWTEMMETALVESMRNKKALADAEKAQGEILKWMSSWCLQDLGASTNRRKIETLVTVHVHQKDVASELKRLGREGKLKLGKEEFDWLMQARFYWDPKGGDDITERPGECRVTITDVSFKYNFEYLGSKERLCITSLTDRCYITLAQALGMYYGGAPAGPAGTGKTETVKDMGRTLGVYVVVTNCTDQHRYKDMGKIFKGLCQSGLWGCFDEFNRIDLEVLSVVAMQVESITSAKKQLLKQFNFPGEPLPITLVQTTGIFITMNPGYAGRQELPENLKVLFRGVTMMVPDREIIIKVKLASVGYGNYDYLAKKFKVLYGLCEEQLSKQRHYDFGLRNILSVLRGAGETKRENPEADEELLLMRTLRDMNLSKLVADDVPLFGSLLKDIFPKAKDPPKRRYEKVEAAIANVIPRLNLIAYSSWVTKIIQLYETSTVRHGFMVVGPAGCGKSCIIQVLLDSLTECGTPHRTCRMNPKAITSQEMYGVKDVISDEWTPGVFASIWQKFNNRALKFTTWIICDGPVDAVWIENLNTVLDDNKILTLANNDRIPMTQNCKLVFEVENLNNASPATVSRCGIVYVSASDLGYKPVLEAWLNTRSEPTGFNRGGESNILRELIDRYVDQGDVFSFLRREVRMVMSNGEVSILVSMLNILTGLLGPWVDRNDTPSREALERMVIYAMTWSFGAMLEVDDRFKMHSYFERCKAPLPKVGEKETVYEFAIDEKSSEWVVWAPAKWNPPEVLNFSSILIPTVDSTRAEKLLQLITTQKKSIYCQRCVLLVGGSGTAKTSTVLMFAQKFNNNEMMFKSVNFSSATTPGLFQRTIEAEVDRRTGKTYGPPHNKMMTVFLDDFSMPFVNTWGDQITLEITRQLIESGGFYFLDKDKRGDFKIVEGLQFLAAMNHPGGGRNDVPNRLKRAFFIFNMILPSSQSVDNIYGAMLRAQFKPKVFSQAIVNVVGKLTSATIELWDRVKKQMLPTPSKFHYVFSMRELSRVFQGVLSPPKEVITSDALVVGLWKHECERVFCDKLASQTDKDWFDQALGLVLGKFFGEDMTNRLQDNMFFCDFQRDDIMNPETGEIDQLAPKVYEPIKSMKQLRELVTDLLGKYNYSNPTKQMDLVLFDDALKHLMRVSRIIQMPRGSALLVGVGGSGKQSLTRLSAFIARQFPFQVQLTKTYNDSSFFDDVRALYKMAGHEGKKVAFLMTDSEVKSESYLEYLNSILSTGEVAGLIPKDERDVMCSELRPQFLKERPGLDDTPLNLYAFFLDRLRDNLHIILCFSPVGNKFRERARKFPGLFNCCTINWFLPWPEDALVSVSQQFIAEFPIYTPTKDLQAPTKDSLTRHMGAVHNMVNEVCDVYFARMRRYVYVTPKSYLSFINSYKDVYKVKFDEIELQASSVKIGLTKLQEAGDDVEKMKIVLKDEEIKLKESEEQTNKLLVKLESESAIAKKKADEVGAQKDDCLAKAKIIEKEQEAANKDLAAALPFLHKAEKAVDSISAKDITELKTMKKPLDIIKLVFDGVLLLNMYQILPVEPAEVEINKQKTEFIQDSFDKYSKSVMSDIRFLQSLIDFSKYEKDNINDETCELIEPYLNLENFDPAIAKKASNAAEGLCTWVGAMVMYHQAAKIVKPKMDELKVQTARMEVAMSQLAVAEEELKKAQDILDHLKQLFEQQFAEKTRIEEGALRTRRKMDQANRLINGLAGEKLRWTEDAKNFDDRKKRLVGDVAVACAFVSYSGPFNSEFRRILFKDYFMADCLKRNIPVSTNLELTKFLVDSGTIGEWNLQGLPTDELSIQNGIMVTRSSRYPLLIDPQGQALAWIKSREEEAMSGCIQCVTNLQNPRLKDYLEFCLTEGKPFLIEGVENEMDSMVDPVLEKQIVVKGKNRYVKVADQMMDFNLNFRMYMTSRLANPHFSPELSAKTTIIDFTVTQNGLEQQLLGRVLSKEQRSLEESLTSLLKEVTNNTKALQILDKQLLQRLSASSGNLLDDVELIEVLANTKAKAKEVELKLKDAAEKKIEINEKRELFRPVATRGSLLYFCIVEMTLVNWMYNTSLNQFLGLFDISIDKSEKAQLPNKRVENIVNYLTYCVYRYCNRGLFERDKRTFVLMIVLKIMVTANKLRSDDVALLLRAGAALDIKVEKPNPFRWMPDKVWLNALAISRHLFGESGAVTTQGNTPFCKEVPELLLRNEAMWRRWYEENEPEAVPIPDLMEKLGNERDLGKFIALNLVRSFREDRTVIAANQFIESMIGQRYTDPVTDSIESIHSESSARNPILFLLSAGADPSSAIDELAKRKKKFPTDKVSMGEGQEPIALEKIKNGFTTGSWVVLQNCHLGLGFMAQLEGILTKVVDPDPDFRLWITCEAHPQFPIGLLQLAIKVTNEPPKGIKAGLHRTYATMVTQDLIDKVDSEKWRSLIFAMCFMHSIVQERRKFGPLGWCVPYEFNNSDLEASLLFSEKHLSTVLTIGQPISWTTVRYMVADVQYGGRVTDDLDRELLLTYADAWLNEKIFSPNFTFNSTSSGDFAYKVPEGAEVARFREFIEGAGVPAVDVPSIFGLHINADLTFRQKESLEMLTTIMETRPKDSGSGGGKSREEIVMDKVRELLSKLPPGYNEDEVRELIRKLKGPAGISDKGMSVPLNIFLFQEIQRLQRVISIVRKTLTDLVDAINGLIIMTPDVLDAMNAIFDARVPRMWMYDPSGAEISWLLPTLGLWFTGLIDRNAQMNDWVRGSRPASYWLTGFFNPQGFLTSMRQEVTRQHKNDQWALDDVVFHSEVKEFDQDRVRDAPSEGVLIHGLFLDGCRWSKAENRLDESEAKKMFSNLPVVYVTAITSKEKKSKGMDYGQFGPYECPVYKYPRRTDKYLIFRVNLRTEVPPSHWTLRGVALLCSTE